MMQQMGKGTANSVAASVIFGCVYYIAANLAPMHGNVVFAWRIIFTVPVLIFFIILSHNWHFVPETLERVKHDKLLILCLLASSASLGYQMWLFMWAPLNNKALDVSLGYFLMPLVMVLFGRIFYKERLQPLQKVAVCFAILGCANQLYQVGSISWATLSVAFGFPVYFVLRRKASIDHLGGLLFDMVLMLPVCFYLLCLYPQDFSLFSTHFKMYVLIPLLGIMSALSIAFYIIACRLLPIGLLGLLGYIEPVLLVVVALVIGERISSSAMPTYIAIWIAIVFLMVEIVRSMRIELLAMRTSRSLQGKNK